MTDIFSDLRITTDDIGNGPSDDVTPDGPQCEVCGRDIPWSGRGRRPKKCQDHRTRTKESAGNDTGIRTPRTSAADKAYQARLDAVVGDLQQGLGELAGTIVPIAPVTAATIAIQGPPATEALVRIAAGHPRFLDGLEMVAKAVPFMAVGKFVAAVMLAVAVDMGRYQPYGMAAEYLRVAEAAQQVGWTPPEQQQEQAATVDRSIPPPPRFKL